MNPKSNYIPVGIPVSIKENTVTQLYPQQNNNIINTQLTYMNNSNLYNQGNIQSNLINNQLNVLQQDLAEVKTVLKSGPVFIVCPYCKNQGFSVPKQSLSCPNIACCLLFGIFGWIGLQAVYKKDINCYDAAHFCKFCGNNVGNYNACC